MLSLLSFTISDMHFQFPRKTTQRFVRKCNISSKGLGRILHVNIALIIFFNHKDIC